METNQATTADALPRKGSPSFGEVVEAIHRKEVFQGSWDFIDPKYREKGPMVAPLCCDNKDKILQLGVVLMQVSLAEFPQDKDAEIRAVIYHLLDFCVAHNISLQYLENLVHEQP